MKNKYYSFLFFIILSCGILKKQEAKTSFEEVECLTIDDNDDNYLFKDFPNREKDYSGCKIRTEFVDGCIRNGSVSNGYKEGKFITEACCCDNLGNLKRLSKEEYFKHGLRDSIFRQFDKDGKVIYETHFKMGTGLWKEFHSNGKIYFEANTKEGYFTDTLHLYNREGEIFEKRLYQKDVLVYYAGNDWSLRYKYKPNDITYLEVDSYEVKNLKQGAFRNTFSYKTKEEFENDQFAKSTLKR
jgi:antitoxin component YwqK of YwqJK toxin-antitoxin module